MDRTEKERKLRAGGETARRRQRERTRGAGFHDADYAFIHLPNGVIQFLRQPLLVGPITRRAIN